MSRWSTRQSCTIAHKTQLVKKKFSRCPLFLASGFLGGFGDLTGLLNLDNGFDDTD